MLLGKQFLTFQRIVVPSDMHIIKIIWKIQIQAFPLSFQHFKTFPHDYHSCHKQGTSAVDVYKIPKLTYCLSVVKFKYCGRDNY